MTRVIARLLTGVVAVAAATTLTQIPTAFAAGDTYVRPGDKIVQADKENRAFSCTVGVVGRNNETGRDIAITSGHCDTNSGNPVYAANGSRIGRYVLSSREETTVMLQAGAAGFAIIELDPSVRATAVTPKLGNLVGRGEAGEGDQLCHSGITTGFSCGKVVAAQTTALTVAMPSRPGDSGGPVIAYVRDGWTAGEYNLVGINQGSVNKTGQAIVEPLSTLIASINASHYSEDWKWYTNPA
ncbi:hypothetical protein TSHO111613_17065 [Tsukamurella hominis]